MAGSRVQAVPGSVPDSRNVAKLVDANRAELDELRRLLGDDAAECDDLFLLRYILSKGSAAKRWGLICIQIAPVLLWTVRLIYCAIRFAQCGGGAILSRVAQRPRQQVPSGRRGARRDPRRGQGAHRLKLAHAHTHSFIHMHVGCSAFTCLTGVSHSFSVLRFHSHSNVECDCETGFDAVWAQRQRDAQDAQRWRPDCHHVMYLFFSLPSRSDSPLGNVNS